LTIEIREKTLKSYRKITQLNAFNKIAKIYQKKSFINWNNL
jgi:hypothetical protein